VTIEAYALTYEHHVPLRCEYRLIDHDGHSCWFLDKANIVINAAGESLFLQGVLVDITKNKQTEQDLSFYRQRLEEMVYQRTEQLEKKCMILMSANANLDAALIELKQANSYAQKSITACHAKIQDLAYQASHDPLTGLVNRRAFEKRVARVLTSAQPDYFQHALCYLDLDHFKHINDNYGHAAGDELLQKISSLLTSKLRQRDNLARIGGDEFALLLEHTALDQARNIADSLCESLRNFSFTWEGTDCSVSASIGLTVLTRAVQDVGELLKNADIACYRAKKKGRNQVEVFIPNYVRSMDKVALLDRPEFFENAG
jgi:diguanylate cyclase (GGDEF)-like protein